MPTPRSIRLSPEQLERIKRLAAATERTEAALMRYALELGLRQLELELAKIRGGTPANRAERETP